MSESVPEQSWGTRLAAAVQKLVGVTAISWEPDGKDNWRYPHVVALKDLSLSSTEEPYTIPEGATVYVDKTTYGCETYKLADKMIYGGETSKLAGGKTIPAVNVKLRQVTEGKLDEWWSPPAFLVSFYIGDVTATYDYAPPLSITVKEGCTAYLAGQDGPPYLVRNKQGGDFEGTVEATSVVIREMGDTVPNHEIKPIELMCFELLPYAAMHADLITKKVFFTGLSSARQNSGSETWAEFLGESLASKPDIYLTDLKTTRFSPGDIIVLYDEHGRGIHTTIASGQPDSPGEPLVYSLSHHPTKNPGCWPIMQVVETFAKTGQPPVVKAKAVTPRSPSMT